MLGSSDADTVRVGNRFVGNLKSGIPLDNGFLGGMMRAHWIWGYNIFRLETCIDMPRILQTTPAIHNPWNID